MMLHLVFQTNYTNPASFLKFHQNFVLVLILLTVIIWAFGKAIFKILFIPLDVFDESKIQKVSSIESLSQFILLGISIYIGINPPMIFVNLIQEAISVLPK